MHAGKGERRAFVDAPDARVCVRASHERRVQHPRKLDVVDVATFAAQERRILLARGGGAEARIDHARSRMRFAAASAASTMP